MDGQVNQEVRGTITFANEVLATIAGVAACDIPGVAGMCGGLKDGIVDMLGKKNLTKGVKVTLAEDVVTVDIQVVVEFGVCVPDLCRNMQDAVAKAIETMAGLRVAAVNIAVQGVRFKEIVTPALEEG